ncbi:hypothetical protein NP233_g6796 [Leucocoprinus birnbaumii]|uniref:Uncharacterized protein n=1 Tax=Leucocoprinus birnbaumii TaxID=56174 RepID=A0AAD5VSQ5_9AGAR|nr:hypothetical protein NP233_g6796 [Leucocoprinus birnbaumii]
MPQETATFFTAEAKIYENITIYDNIPQAVINFVACAKHLKSLQANWIFLTVDLDKKGEGTTYWASEVVEWSPVFKGDATVPITSNRDGPAVIAGILSSWVSDSYSEFDGDQWFYKFTPFSGAENQGILE